jgi:hypothetical protein
MHKSSHYTHHSQCMYFLYCMFGILHFIYIYFMHFNLCISTYVSYHMHLIICILSYTSYHMPHILYAYDFMRPIQWFQLYTFLYMLFVLFSTFELLLKLVAHRPTDGPTDRQTLSCKELLSQLKMKATSKKNLFSIPLKFRANHSWDWLSSLRFIFSILK